MKHKEPRRNNPWSLEAVGFIEDDRRIRRTAQKFSSTKSCRNKSPSPHNLRRSSQITIVNTPKPKEKSKGEFRQHSRSIRICEDGAHHHSRSYASFAILGFSALSFRNAGPCVYHGNCKTVSCYWHAYAMWLVPHSPHCNLQNTTSTILEHIQASAFTNAVKLTGQILVIAPGDEDALRCKVVTLINSCIVLEKWMLA